MDVHSWFYLFSIVFWDISIPLLESMLLSLLQSSRNWTFNVVEFIAIPVEIGPSNAFPG